MKRNADGRFERIGLEQALDEIAAKLREVIDDATAPDAVAGFRGTMNYSNSIANRMLPDWLRCDRVAFLLLDDDDRPVGQVDHGRAPRRLGRAGKIPYDQADVLLVIGANPLVSLSTFNLTCRTR